MVVMLILDEIYANIYDFEVDPIKEYLKKDVARKYYGYGFTFQRRG